MVTTFTSQHYSKVESSEQDADVAENELLSQRVCLATVGVWLVAGMLSMYGLYIGRSLIVPILLGFFGYLTLRPIVRAAKRIGVPSVVTATCLMVVIAVAIAFGGYLLSGPAQQVLENAPQTIASAKSKLWPSLWRALTLPSPAWRANSSRHLCWESQCG